MVKAILVPAGGNFVSINLYGFPSVSPALQARGAGAFWPKADQENMNDRSFPYVR